MSCTKRVFPTRLTQNCFMWTWLLSAVPCTSQQLVCLLHLVYSMISDVCYHEWPATSRAEPVPSRGTAATLKHPKLPLLAATSIRCGSFEFFFLCRPSCEVRIGQRGRSLQQGTEGHWGQGEVLVRCQTVLGWGTGSSCALISSRGLFTHGNHPAADLVGVPEPANLQWNRPTNTSHPPLGTSPAVSALESIPIVKLRVWCETTTFI